MSVSSWINNIFCLTLMISVPLSEIMVTVKLALLYVKWLHMSFPQRWEREKNSWKIPPLFQGPLWLDEYVWGLMHTACQSWLDMLIWFCISGGVRCMDRNKRPGKWDSSGGMQSKYGHTSIPSHYICAVAKGKDLLTHKCGCITDVATNPASETLNPSCISMWINSSKYI